MKAYIVFCCENPLKLSYKSILHSNAPVKGIQSRRAYIFTHLWGPVSHRRVCGGSLWSQGTGTQSWVLRMPRRVVSKS